MRPLNAKMAATIPMTSSKDRDATGDMERRDARLEQANLKVRLYVRHGSANANNALPAAIATYCLPSTA